MDYTGAGFISGLIRDIGDDVNDADYRALVRDWCQEGIDAIFRRLPNSAFTIVRNALNTVANTNGYSFSATNLYSENILSIRDKNLDRPLTYLDVKLITEYNLDLELKGQPVYYYIYGYDITTKQVQVFFHPIPNAVYNLEVTYRIKTYLFSDDATIIYLPEHLLSILRHYVRAQAYRVEGNKANSDSEMQIFYLEIEEENKTKTSEAAYRQLRPSDLPSITDNFNRAPVPFYGGGSSSIGASGVTSVGLTTDDDDILDIDFSPVTTSGNIRINFQSGNNNKFLATPDNVNGYPGYRDIVLNDLPSIPITKFATTGGTALYVPRINAAGNGWEFANISGGGGSNTYLDNVFRIQDNSDNTKQLAFECTSITSGITRTLTIPNENGTIDLTTSTNTLQNKTLDSSNILSIKDSNFELVDDGDTTKKFKIQLSGFTSANTRIFTPPNADFTLNTVASGKLLYASADNVISQLTLGTNLSISSGTLNASGGGSVTFDAIGDSVANGTVDNIGYAQNWTWNSLAGATGLKLSSTSTAAASNAQILFEIALSGANSTSSQTTYAAKFTNTHTGTSSTNTALYLSASGGSINNSLYSAAGDVTLIGGANSVYFQASTGHLIIRNGNTYSTNFYSDNDLGINGTAILLKYSTTYTTNMKITTGGSLAGIIAHHGSTAKTANYTLSASEDSNVTHTNVGASGTVTETLPATPVLGERHRLVRVAAFTFEFLANTGQTIRDAGSVSSSGGKLQLNNVGDVVEVEYVDTNKWFVTYKNVASAPTLT